MKYLIPFFFLLISTASYAQTGPGGVGDVSSNGMWLKADDLTLSNNAAVTSWADASGNGNDAAQGTATKQPIFITSGSMNGMPAVRFDGTGDELSILDDVILDGTAGITFYAAIRPANLDNSPRGILGKRISSGTTSQYAYTWFFYTGRRLYLDVNNQGDRFSTDIFNPFYGNSINYILNWSFDGSLPTASRSSIKTDGATTKTSSESSTTIINSSQNLILGALNTNYGTYLGADYSEVIHFNFALNRTQDILVNNYLSAKYAVTLDSNGIYAQSSGANGDYDFDVAGIGRMSSTDLHDEAQGSGIVRVLNPTGLGDGEFLIWGRDNGDFYFTENSDVPSGVFARMDRTWRVNEVDTLGSAIDVGTIDMYFDITDLSAYVSADLRLLIDQDNDGLFDDETPITGTLVGNSLQFSLGSTDLENGERFTLASASEGDIIWNGTAYSGGSGPSEAPNTSDSSKRLYILGTTGVISANGFVKQLIVESGNDLTINSNIYLEISNNITNDGTVAISNNGSLIQNSTGANGNSGSGTYTIQRTGNTSPTSYNIWSSPIQSTGIISAFGSINPCDVYVFDETIQFWNHDYTAGFSTTCGVTPVTFTVADVISGGDGIMDIGRGYFIPGNATNTRTFTGSINNGDITYPIITTALGNKPDWNGDDWNLVGNPYPSALNATSFWNLNAVTNGNISDAIYFWDDDLSGGPGYSPTIDYASWNLSGGVASGNSGGTPNGNISSGQGFWIHATNSANLEFSNSMRTTTNNQFFKHDEEGENHNVWIGIRTPSTLQNNILVGFNSNSTDGIDRSYDARKLIGNSHIKLASRISNQEYVIQSVSPIMIGTSKVIPLSVLSDEDGVHTFYQYKEENLSKSIKIILRDNLLGISHDIRKSNYSAHLIGGKEYTNRFELIFDNTIPNIEDQQQSNSELGSNQTINNVTDTDIDYYKLIQTQTGLIITNSNGITGHIQIIDITGKVIWSQTSKQLQIEMNIPLNNLAVGVYLIRITNDQEQIFQQKFVK